eukprot:2172946-Pleurochrysis_carterae.AAC.1
MPAGELLAASDAALAGVLYNDGRRGVAVPSLRVERDAVTLPPCDAGLPLAAAVELAYGGDDPQEVPLQVAMAALGLKWQLSTPARDGAAGAVADGTGARSGALTTAWLAGAGGESVLTRRRTTQLSMLGMVTATPPSDSVPARGVAQFTAAIGGEAQASAAVEAALLAGPRRRGAGGRRDAADGSGAARVQRGAAGRARGGGHARHRRGGGGVAGGHRRARSAG